MAPKHVNRLLSIGNVAFFVGTLVVNVLSNALPLGGRTAGEISDSIPNLFVPAGLTFSIWGIIYLLLLGFAVYQILKLSLVEKIGTLFMISSAANILWILVWHAGYVGLSLACMGILLVSLIAIYLRLEIGVTKTGRLEFVLGRLPFSVYLGWITVATVANVTALAVTRDWGGFGAGDEFWAIVVIVAATCITAAMIWTRRDIGYALVVLWSFYGIILKRTDSMTTPTTYVVPATIVCMGLIVLTGVLKLLLRRKSTA